MSVTRKKAANKATTGSDIYRLQQNASVIDTTKKLIAANTGLQKSDYVNKLVAWLGPLINTWVDRAFVSGDGRWYEDATNNFQGHLYGEVGTLQTAFTTGKTDTFSVAFNNPITQVDPAAVLMFYDPTTGNAEIMRATVEPTSSISISSGKTTLTWTGTPAVTRGQTLAIANNPSYSAKAFTTSTIVMFGQPMHGPLLAIAALAMESPASLTNTMKRQAGILVDKYTTDARSTVLANDGTTTVSGMFLTGSQYWCGLGVTNGQLVAHQSGDRLVIRGLLFAHEASSALGLTAAQITRIETIVRQWIYNRFDAYTGTDDQTVSWQVDALYHAYRRGIIGQDWTRVAVGRLKATFKGNKYKTLFNEDWTYLYNYSNGVNGQLYGSGLVANVGDTTLALTGDVTGTFATTGTLYILDSCGQTTESVAYTARSFASGKTTFTLSSGLLFNHYGGAVVAMDRAVFAAAAGTVHNQHYGSQVLNGMYWLREMIADNPVEFDSTTLARMKAYAHGELRFLGTVGPFFMANGYRDRQMNSYAPLGVISILRNPALWVDSDTPRLIRWLYDGFVNNIMNLDQEIIAPTDCLTQKQSAGYPNISGTDAAFTFDNADGMLPPGLDGFSCGTTHNSGKYGMHDHFCIMLGEALHTPEFWSMPEVGGALTAARPSVKSGFSWKQKALVIATRRIANTGFVFAQQKTGNQYNGGLPYLFGGDPLGIRSRSGHTLMGFAAMVDNKQSDFQGSGLTGASGNNYCYIDAWGETLILNNSNRTWTHVGNGTNASPPVMRTLKSWDFTDADGQVLSSDLSAFTDWLTSVRSNRSAYVDVHTVTSFKDDASTPAGPANGATQVDLHKYWRFFADHVELRKVYKVVSGTTLNTSRKENFLPFLGKCSVRYKDGFSNAWVLATDGAADGDTTILYDNSNKRQNKGILVERKNGAGIVSGTFFKSTGAVHGNGTTITLDPNEQIAYYYLPRRAYNICPHIRAIINWQIDIQQSVALVDGDEYDFGFVFDVKTTAEADAASQWLDTWKTNQKLYPAVSMWFNQYQFEASLNHYTVQEGGWMDWTFTPALLTGSDYVIVNHTSQKACDITMNQTGGLSISRNGHGSVKIAVSTLAGVLVASGSVDDGVPLVISSLTAGNYQVTVSA